MSNHRIVTISNRPPSAWYYLWNEFIQTTKDYAPLILQPSYWGGLSTKPKVLYSAIKQGLIPEKRMIFCDCWDLIFATTPEEIIEMFETHFDAPIVISSETNCFPTDLKEDFDSLNPPTKYAYLNSGFIVGDTEAILACLEAMDLANLPDDHYDPIKQCNIHPNDQFEWQKIFVKQLVKIQLDYSQILSQTLHGAKIEEFDLNDERGIRNIITDSYPCSLHFNGGSKDDMNIRKPILQKLNLWKGA